MPDSALGASWDVTFLFPGGKCSLFRCVPLRNIESLCELTHEAAESVLGTKIQIPHEEDDTLLPGFIVYHVPVEERSHLDIEPLRPTIASWHLLCQRQPSGNRSIFLQVVRKKHHLELDKTQREITATMNSTPERKSKYRREGLHLNSSNGKYQDPASVHEYFRKSDTSSYSDVRRSVLFSPKWDCDCIANSPLKLNCSPRPSPPEVLTLPVKHSVHRSTFSYIPSSDKGDGAVHEGLITVRMFALQFVITRIHAFLSDINKELMDRGKCEKNGAICFSRDVIVYLAAAMVKEWQSSVALRYDAMNEAWGSLPPLLQNAQLDYLQCILSRQFKRLRAEFLARPVSAFGTDTALFEKSPYMNRIEPIHLVPHLEEEKSQWGITEVTYCSASGPLPVPRKQAYMADDCCFKRNNNNISYGVALTLTAPPFISFLEELAVVGRIYSSHRVGLFWWILDETDESIEPVTLSISDWYFQGRITTFEITPQTFTLTVNSGSLQAGHRYRLIAQVCDVHTGECASCELKLDGTFDTYGPCEADSGWAVAVSRAYPGSGASPNNEKNIATETVM